MLRGGAFKPRTSPFAFKGLGVGGAARSSPRRARETGLPIVTELLDPSHAGDVAEHADVVQIGARNMQNYALLEVAGKLGKPVLLKRGLSSSLDELLMAADYVLKEGNPNVILCERGIRTFETATRFTLDLGAVPWLKIHTHLPVIVDPSHASGDRRLVEPLSRAAAAVGADGIIVEVHEDPEHALCDGPQALYAADFAAFAEHVAAHAQLCGKKLGLMDLGIEGRVAVVTGRRLGHRRRDGRAPARRRAPPSTTRRARPASTSRSPTPPRRCWRSAGVDILVNSAGTSFVRDLAELTDEDWQEQWELHVMGPMRLMRALAPRHGQARLGAHRHRLLLVGQAPVADQRRLLGDQGGGAVAVAHVRRRLRRHRRARQRGHARRRRGPAVGGRGRPRRPGRRGEGHHARGGARRSRRPRSRSGGWPSRARSPT